MATTKQMLTEIIAKLDKLLEKSGAAKPWPTVEGSKPVPDPFVGPNVVIPPGSYFPSGTRPDGGQWVNQEQFDEFCKKTGYEPKCH